jgi:hypothetical protein
MQQPVSTKSTSWKAEGPDHLTGPATGLVAKNTEAQYNRGSCRCRLLLQG